MGQRVVWRMVWTVLLMWPVASPIWSVTRNVPSGAVTYFSDVSASPLSVAAGALEMVMGSQGDRTWRMAEPSGRVGSGNVGNVVHLVNGAGSYPMFCRPTQTRVTSLS